MSQIHHARISLEELVDRAQIILLARPLSRVADQEAIPMDVGPTWNGQPCPDFIRYRFRYRVSAVLRDVTRALASGQEITVEQANLEAQMALHRSYYVEGLSLSPIYLAYQPSVSYERLEAEEEQLLFLSARVTGDALRLAYAVDGAQDTAALAGRVWELLRR